MNLSWQFIQPLPKDDGSVIYQPLKGYKLWSSLLGWLVTGTRRSFFGMPACSENIARSLSFTVVLPEEDGTAVWLPACSKNIARSLSFTVVLPEEDGTAVWLPVTAQCACLIYWRVSCYSTTPTWIRWVSALPACARRSQQQTSSTLWVHCTQTMPRSSSRCLESMSKRLSFWIYWCC